MGSYLTQFSRKCIFVFLFILSKESALSSFYITYVLASLYLNSRYISVIYKMKLPHVSTYECFAYHMTGHNQNMTIVYTNAFFEYGLYDKFYWHGNINKRNLTEF